MNMLKNNNMGLIRFRLPETPARSLPVRYEPEKAHTYEYESEVFDDRRQTAIVWHKGKDIHYMKVLVRLSPEILVICGCVIEQNTTGHIVSFLN